MKLDSELADLIVEKTAKILGENINIMDEFGVIVGSGDKNRINRFHEGAAEVISTGQPLEITNKDVQELEGVKPGINLPIEFNQEIIGVVGITGQPAEIRDYAELVKITVELMLEQSVLKEELKLEDKAHANFIQDLIAGERMENEDLIKARAQVLGYNLMVPRIALIVGVDNFWDYAYQQLNEVKQGEENLEEQIYIQQLKNEILQDIRSLFHQDGEDMISIVGSNNFLVLKSFNVEMSEAERKDYLINLGYKIKRSLLNKKNLQVTIGIGNYHSSIEGISESFNEALEARKIGARLLGSNEVYHINDLGLGRLIEEISPATRDWFVNLTLGSNDQPVELDAELLETLKVFFENDLNVSQAARELYIHRNTLLYRLDKIEAETNLDPRKFNDALRLKIAIMMKENNS